MKHYKIIAAMLAATLCLSACGKVDDFGKKNSSYATVATTATTDDPDTPDIESKPDDDQTAEITTIIPDSIPDNASVSNETKIPETSDDDKKTTTTKLPANEIPETTTTLSADEPAPEVSDTKPSEPELPAENIKPNDFINKIRVIYNDIEFGLGDKMSEIVESLGEQANSSGIVISNLSPNDIAEEYYFFGMNVQVKNDIVFSIEITDNMFYGDTYGYTVGGLSMSSNRADVENAHGTPSRSDYLNNYYEYEGQSLQVTFAEDGSSARILITYNNI